MSNTPRIVVQGKRSRLRFVLVVILVATCAAGVYAFYQQVRQATAREFQVAKGELEHLRAEQRRLSRELGDAKDQAKDLRAEIAFLKQGKQINQQACAAVEQSLPSLQAENAKLREQVAFYRNVVSPPSGESGIRIRQLRLSATQDPRRWRFDLLLTRSSTQGKRADGVIELEVKGHADGKFRRLTQKTIFEPDTPPLVYSIRNKEELGGELQLPDGFQPDLLTVTLIPKAGVRTVAEFDWDRLLAVGENAS
ncbi:MAG: DUF6776 family protein [Panacagrimonas sp.]